MVYLVRIENIIAGQAGKSRLNLLPVKANGSALRYAELLTRGEVRGEESRPEQLTK